MKLYLLLLIQVSRRDVCTELMAGCVHCSVHSKGASEGRGGLSPAVSESCGHCAAEGWWREGADVQDCVLFPLLMLIWASAVRGLQ